MSSQRRDSQFAGAAALFQKKERELLEHVGSPRQFEGRKGASTSNLNFSLSPSPERLTVDKSLKAPRFHSPGTKSRMSWQKLDKPALSLPEKDITTRASAMGFQGLPLSPSPTKEEQRRINQTVPSPQSPTRLLFNSTLQPPPFTSPGAKARPAWATGEDNRASSYFGKSTGSTKTLPTTKAKTNGASFQRLSFSPESRQDAEKIDGKPVAQGKGSPQNSSSPPFGAFNLRMTRQSNKSHRDSVMAPLPETPDITIEVKIPDIDQKIKARRASKKAQASDLDENVPEHIRKYRQREANRKKAEKERRDQAATKLRAFFLGWKARAEYPKLVEDNMDRLLEIRRQEELRMLKIRSAIKIQKTFRGLLPRRRFRYVLACKRRREKNEKEIKQIKKKLTKMPKLVKADLKELKKQNATRKKEVRKQLKKQLKEEFDHIEDVRSQGHSMIEYLKAENNKIRERQRAMDADYNMLEKQFDILALKSEETARNFASLRHYVKKKSASLQKKEINSHKCRHRYLPKYREEIKERDRHCLTEYHVKVMYKKQLETIVREIVKRSTDINIAEEAIEALTACETEIASIPTIPTPEGLEGHL